MELTAMTFAFPKKKYHNGGHLIYSCQYHVIFCPKYRRPVLDPPYDRLLKENFMQTAADNGFSILQMEVMPDHVHLLIDCDPRFGINKCVRLLKGNSSHFLRNGYPELKKKLPTLWTRSAFISTVGAVSLEIVQKYIADQKNR